MCWTLWSILCMFGPSSQPFAFRGSEYVSIEIRLMWFSTYLRVYVFCLI